MHKVFLAVDLGASSGRVVAGSLDGSRLELDELHRFENRPVTAAGSMYWDILRLWADIKEGLRRAHQKYGNAVASVGVDTWGVDFGLLDRDDRLIGNPVHYRDPRTQGVMQSAFQTVPREEIFAQTGLQFMEFNTLYQLIAMRRSQTAALEQAKSFLMIPDLIHWFMTGIKSNEITNATTTQLFNPVARGWAGELLAQFDLPSDIFLPVAQPGTILGPLSPDVARETGLSGVQVVLPGTHDTASAVMAVPAAAEPSDQPDWCYISSGTWSLMGVEVVRPVINGPCATWNFTNEGGVGGTTRLLKNIGGLWLVQECRRMWNLQGHDYAWDQLVTAARQARPLASVIDPDHPDFLAPTDMPAAIARFCERTGQPVPPSHGATIRAALESLALRYRQVLGWLEQLTGNSISRVHVVGGGVQNELLCQMTADACQRPVLAGPVEATALGNLMMQIVASGQVRSIAEARTLIGSSFPVHTYAPRDDADTIGAWDAAFETFQRILPA